MSDTKHLCSAPLVGAKRLRAITDAALDGMIMIDPQEEITFWNPAAERIFGYSHSEALGKKLHTLILPQRYRDDHLAGFARFCENGVGTVLGKRLELSACCKDGKEISVEMSVAGIALADGYHAVSFIKDITIQKRMEMRDHNRLRIMEHINTEKPLLSILDLIVKALEMEDPEALCSILLLSDDGSHLLLGAAPSLPDFYNQAINGMQIGDGVGSCGTAVFRKERVIVEDILNHPYWERARKLVAKTELRSCWSEPVIATDGSILGTFAIYHRYPCAPEEHDVEYIHHAAHLVSIAIGHKRAENDRFARKGAEAASQAKSVFLSNMSHEIRTPMNAILGFAQLLDSNSTLTPQQAEYVRIINRSGKHLLNLINDILDMSKIESGRMDMVVTEFSLDDFINDLEAMFRSRIEAKGVQMQVDRATDLPHYISADEVKMRQVVVNLLGNAVKFTLSGTITLSVSARVLNRDADQASNVALKFVVADSGPGISPIDIGDIFTAFQQAEAGVEVGGTGLGLAISRNLAEVMGGGLNVSSEVGCGSTFCFDIPVQTLPNLTVQSPKTLPQTVVALAEASSPVRVLVVDSKPDSRYLLSATLEPVGFSVVGAGTRDEAVAIFESFTPHVVLIEMRIAYGDDFVDSIKTLVAGHNVPVIAVTASVFGEDVDGVALAGVDDYLRLPFQAYELFALLKKYLQIEYIYAEDVALDSAISMDDVVTSLPAQLVTDMAIAVAEGDMSLLKKHISRAADIDQLAAEKLLIMADQYAYDELGEWLKQMEENHGCS